MSKRIQKMLLWMGACSFGLVLQAHAAQPCPGYNQPHNTNLACELATATGASQGHTLAGLSTTLASQLSQLPLATAASGSGLTLSRSLGVFTASSDSLGTILTQRGETIGKHKWLVSFTYQHFGFGSIDGMSLHHFATLNSVTSGGNTSVTQANNDINLTVDQFTGLVTVGLTNRIDATVIIPFSQVTLDTTGNGSQYLILNGAKTTPSTFTNYYPGSAFGMGDAAVNIKVNAFKGEHTSIAVGGELRFPTGDENNYLGTGAYGIKPYMVVSRRGRITPNLNIGYQFNGKSSLNQDPNTGEHLRLPSSFFYSGGADFRVTKRFTLVGEFVGQAVIDGPRAVFSSAVDPITNPTGQLVMTGTKNETYAMNNAGVGFKMNPFKGLFFTASALFKLDDPGLRSKVIPLAGISYRF